LEQPELCLLAPELEDAFQDGTNFLFKIDDDHETQSCGSNGPDLVFERIRRASTQRRAKIRAELEKRPRIESETKLLSRTEWRTIAGRTYHLRMLLGLPFVRLVLAVGSVVAESTVDWAARLEALGKSDSTALAQVRRLITGQLARMRAYETREGWDDLAQEIIVKVWRAHRDGKIRDYRALPGFVRTLTRNAVIDALRKRQPDLGKEADDVERVAISPDDSLDPGTQLALRNAMGQLEERHREVVERVYLQGMSYDETAADLGRPRGTVNRLQREAMQQLREILLPAEEVVT
jgi:RNA polymerase sigma-70 factor, ECF subfamily